MNKNKKRIASGLVLAGSSLSSIAGQAATNVSAEGSIYGSIKNFFTKSRNKREGTKVEDSLKLQKEKIINLLEKGKLAKEGGVDVPIHLYDALKIRFASIVVCTVIGVAGLLTEGGLLVTGGLSVLLVIGFIRYMKYVREHNSLLKDAEKARANVKGKIKEDMLNRQYTLKEFEDIVKDDEECSEFIRQLLVLERDPESEPNDGGYKLLDNGELEDAKEVLKKLFEVSRGDEMDEREALVARNEEKFLKLINELKNFPSQEKEKLLKVVKPLVEWMLGNMSSISGEGDCFCKQNDTKFCAKVFSLASAIVDNGKLCLYAES